MPTKQAKHWCWTLNNYTTDEEDHIKQLGQQFPEPIQYLVYGRETGEEGTHHLQGFISFKNKIGFKRAKGLICDRAHFESAKGTPKQAANYCTKDGDFEEWGQVPYGQGHRSDLKQVIEKLQNGATMRAIAKDHPSDIIRYGSGIIRARQFYRPKREKPPTIWVLWGRTGTGKTRRVWEYADLDELWVHSGDRWFDGYDGQRGVLFDDFDGSWFKLTYLLKLIDRYVMQVPIKGGFQWWCPTTIYITSNLNPTDWYPTANEEHKRALKRRLREFGHVQECQKY
ncbi:hypothetical protein N9924_01410 [bacterium]|nr:hypothetical protein [bacterium]